MHARAKKNNKMFQLSFNYSSVSTPNHLSYQSLMPAIRTGKPSDDSVPPKRHRKANVPYVSLRDFSSQFKEKYVHLKTRLDLASRSEFSSKPSSTECYLSISEHANDSDNTETSLQEPITINGVLLRPTVAFDTFWRFAAERKAIDDRRRAGEPAP